MRILHFSTDDITGGAAKAAYRLHLALREAGHDSKIIVRHKKSDDEAVIQARPPQPRPWQSRLQRLRQRIPGLRSAPLAASYTFNFDLAPQIDERSLFELKPGEVDIICLHWITGLLDTRLIRALRDHYYAPMVWVTPDQEAVTGGCHYSFGCAGFTKQCGHCPQLESSGPDDRSRVIWRRKQKYLADISICFVAGSSWVFDRIRESSLFGQRRIERIAYPIDVSTFRPIDKTIARDLLHLPQDKKIIFCGATYLEDRRKGMKQLIEALHHLGRLSVNREDIFLLVAGLQGKALMSQLPFAGKHIGHLNNDLTLALAYQAADVFVCPSIEDAGPMMIPEAMLCGTPVVAFNAGGAPDLVETGQTGYLARLPEAEDLAQGLRAVLAAPNASALRQNAHTAAARLHTPSFVARRHTELYESLLLKGQW